GHGRPLADHRSGRHALSGHRRARARDAVPRRQPRLPSSLSRAPGTIQRNLVRFSRAAGMSDAGLPDKFVTVAGIRTRYLEAGSRGPVIVLAHNLDFARGGFCPNALAW